MSAIDSWIRDFTHSARGLTRTPGFTLTVVATLALAVGANASIFSVVKPVLLKPLPFPDADRLVYLGGTFEVQQPDGPLFKFTLTLVGGRLQGEMAGERDGVVLGHAKVDAAKAN